MTLFLPDAHTRTTADVCAALGTDPVAGLAAADAAARLATAGANALTAAPTVPGWRKFLAQFKSPLVLLLIAAGAISLAVWAAEGTHGIPYEALTILAIVALNAVLGLVQEARAEEAVASLARMSAATATVVRDGERLTVPAEDLVPGDVLLVEEGATVGADARVTESVSLQTLEAALTGESAPVTKDVAPVPAEAAIGDRVNMLYAGTTVTYGHGRALVVATGMHAEMGRIAGLLQSTAAEQTPLQADLDRLGRVLGAVVIAIAIVVGATILVLQHDHSTAALTGVLLYTVSLAVSAVPEGLAAITTIVLSLGMQRMAKRNAIVRKLAAVETLGSVTVIASDKTGTLTKNEMTIRVVLTASGVAELTGSGYAPVGELEVAGRPLPAGAQRTEVERTLAAGWLANNAELAQRDGEWRIAGDPTEAALLTAALKAGLSPERLGARFARHGEIPFSADRRMMSTVHADAYADDGGHVLMSKGAPDVLLARCVYERAGNDERSLDATRRAEIGAALDALAADALRLIGLAYRRLPAAGVGAVAGAEAGADVEDAMIWLGAVGMIDPPRAEAATAIRAAQHAGVRVVMITGDHPAAAGAIAAELGIAPRGASVLTSVDFGRLDATAFAAAVRATSVFARVSPEHKLAIVRALQADGEVVAMTGDGVNDAPALKAADIGIAMGRAGTDVARGAADMVLADDNFATIVAAIEEGRSIYANIQKFLRYLLSTNLGEVVVMFFGVALAGLLGIVAGRGESLVLPLLPTMILWINLVTDGLPALAVGVDPADPGQMDRPPRAPGVRVITRRMWWGMGVVSVVMGTGTLAVLDGALPGGVIDGSGDVGYARTLAFHTLVLYQLFAVFCVRSDEATTFHGLFANGWLWLSIAAAVALQAAVIYAPTLQKAFGTVALSLSDWGLCTAVASTVVVAYEAVKWHWRRRDRQTSAAAAH
ncbi:MAG: cation-translocating P-type ATPase [Betaproteobacteria bacterium]